MRIRKTRLGPSRDLGLRKGTTPGQYRKHAKYVLGEEAGAKKADIHQRKYYEAQAGGVKKKPAAKPKKAVESPIKREKFKPATKKEIEALVKKSLKKKKKKKKK